MPRYTARERRERYLREYEFQKKTGKPFFPNAVFHDSVTSLIVLLIIIGISIGWHAGFGEVPTDPTAGREGSAWFGPAYESRADPGIEEYDPRPEWYYFFLFELLRVFKQPELLIVGAMLIPTAWMILLIGWPFLDRNPDRRLSRRPIARSIGALVPVMLLALTWYGAKAPGAGAGAADLTKPGAQAFSTNGCATCHTLSVAGAAGAVGPNFNSTPVDYATALDFITNGKGGMPKFGGQLTDDGVKCMAAFVATYSGGVNNEPGPQAGSAEADYDAACAAAGPDYAGAAGG